MPQTVLLIHDGDFRHSISASQRGHRDPRSNWLPPTKALHSMLELIAGSSGPFLAGEFNNLN